MQLEVYINKKGFFERLKACKTYPWKHTHGGVLLLVKLEAKSSRFINCTNGTKSCKASYLLILNQWWVNRAQEKKFINLVLIGLDRSSRPEVFLRKVVLRICSKFTGEYSCQSVISIKLLCNFIEIARRHGYSPVNLPHTLRTPFLRTLLDDCFCLD